MKALFLALALSSAQGLWAREPDLDPARLRRAEQSLQQLMFGKAILREAESYIGTPYIWGGKDADPGFDCSGYTSYVFKRYGVTLPDGALQQYLKGIAIEKPALQVGDLVFFVSSSVPLHVGIYAGEGEFLHAPGTGKHIRLDSLSKGHWKQAFVGARRFFASRVAEATPLASPTLKASLTPQTKLETGRQKPPQVTVGPSETAPLGLTQNATEAIEALAIELKDLPSPGPEPTVARIVRPSAPPPSLPAQPGVIAPNQP